LDLVLNSGVYSNPTPTSAPAEPPKGPWKYQGECLVKFLNKQFGRLRF